MLTTITVCSNCGKKSCDGGLWKIIKVVNIKNCNDTTSRCHPSVLISCTLRWFGTKKEFKNKPIGFILTKEFLNWSSPAKVTLEKIQ